MKRGKGDATAEMMKGCDGKAVTYGEPMWRGREMEKNKDGDFYGL